MRATQKGATGSVPAKVRRRIRRLATSLRREVRLMGDGQRAKALRFVICFLIIFVIMVYISPKVR